MSAPAFPGVGVQPFQGSSAGGSAPVSPSQPPAQSVPAPLPPQPQLVAVLAGLRQAADGSYRVALQLQPAELGTVSVQVDVRRGVASVHFRTDKAGTSDALRAGLDQLRGELLASGLSIDDITVAVTSQDGGSLGDHGRHPASSADDEDAEWVPLASANSTNQNRIRPSLDVRL
ncbi:MAG: flagellar hook-length control protein FliK [Acidothermus sp.]|nr:flagellar hook-length control protein FliK [Acidothermus sp.]